MDNINVLIRKMWEYDKNMRLSDTNSCITCGGISQKYCECAYEVFKKHIRYEHIDKYIRNRYKMSYDIYINILIQQ